MDVPLARKDRIPNHYVYSWKERNILRPTHPHCFFDRRTDYIGRRPLTTLNPIMERQRLAGVKCALTYLTSSTTMNPIKS